MAFKHHAVRRLRHDGPIHLVLDSTRLQPFGQGEWDSAKRGRTRRMWRKLNLVMDADSGETAAHVPTDANADDAAQAPTLLRQSKACRQMRADGACDPDPAYRAAADCRHDPPPDVIIPPRATAMPSIDTFQLQTSRDRHIQLMAGRARIGGQRATGYGGSIYVENTIGRYKHPVDPEVSARTFVARRGEAAIAIALLNRMIRIAKPTSNPLG